MTTERNIHRTIADIFLTYCGRNGISYEELGQACGAAASNCQEFKNGRYLSSAAALVYVCQQNGQAWAALKAAVERGAQQSHGCDFEMNREVASAGMAFADALADGRVDHRERHRLINALRRLKARAGLYLQAHAQRAA